ncbi:MAG: ABC transporter permease subunit [Clostridiales bacterium]|nr:ABC transporter permease subunit [Clostridiales bacterium]
MTVFRKELREGTVSLLVWSAILGGLMAVCVGIYPSMSDSIEDMSALFAGMGDFSAAFGLDKLQYGSMMGFYGTECGNILGLGGAFYAALTAMGLLAGEEGGHTAEFLLTHPVSRLRVAGEKLAALAVLVVGLNLVCFTCGAVGILAIGEEADWGDLLCYHGALLLMQLEIGALCFGLSALLRRGGLGLAMGLAALLYFAGLLINLDQGLDWLRFVTPYYYADAARIFAGETLAGPMLAGCALGALGAGFGLWWYRRKDIA